jgi:hypothetical protein
MRALLACSCAASAGIHAGIVPEHLHEEPRLGVAFVIAALVVLTLARAVVTQPSTRGIGLIAGLVLAGLIAAYVASRTTGIPFVSPGPESVDPVGTAAVSIELLGVTCALALVHPNRRRRRRSIPQEVAS